MMEPSEDLIKCGVRHYAHAKCYLDAGKPLAELPKYVIGQFPYSVLEERGLLDEARRLMGKTIVEAARKT
jgi:hypothetical protein